jgi:hypothetical protein
VETVTANYLWRIADGKWQIARSKEQGEEGSKQESAGNKLMADGKQGHFPRLIFSQRGLLTLLSSKSSLRSSP